MNLPRAARLGDDSQRRHFDVYGGLQDHRIIEFAIPVMWEGKMDVVLRAQSRLMSLYDVTSEAALGLLVWAATDDGVTVLEVASSICRQTDVTNEAPIQVVG